MPNESQSVGHLDPSSGGPNPHDAIQQWRSTDDGFTLRQAAWLVLILTILFPYVQLLPVATDVQPNFFIAFAVLGPFLLTLRTDELMLLAGIVTVLLLYTVFNPVAESFRAWSAYLTPALILVVARTLGSRPDVAQWLDIVLRRSFFVWIGFGALQFVTGSTIVTLTFRASTTDDRGWMSFASEPSAFGSILFLFAAYFLTRKMYGLALISLLVVAIVAQSAVGMTYFVILGLTWALVRARRAALLATIVGFFVALIWYFFGDLENLIDFLPEGRRVTRILELLLSDDADTDDASIASRAADLVEAYNTLISGSPFGNGFGLLRLKSGWGAYVYELGWIGLFLAIGWIIYFIRAAAQVNRDVLAATLAIIAMLFSSTPLSMPTASFIILAMILAAKGSAGEPQADNPRPEA